MAYPWVLCQKRVYCGFSQSEEPSVVGFSVQVGCTRFWLENRRMYRLLAVVQNDIPRSELVRSELVHWSGLFFFLWMPPRGCGPTHKEVHGLYWGSFQVVPIMHQSISIQAISTAQHPYCESSIYIISTRMWYAWVIRFEKLFAKICSCF